MSGVRDKLGVAEIFAHGVGWPSEFACDSTDRSSLCDAAFFLVDLIEKASPVHTHNNNNYRFIAIMQVNLH